MYPDGYSYRAITRNRFAAHRFGETGAERFRRTFPDLPTSSKIAPSLEARIALDLDNAPRPRCSRFQRTSSAGSTTTSTVGDIIARYDRPTGTQRSFFSSAAETTTFSSTASRFQRRPSTSSATETTTFSSTASRFQSRPSVASVAETTTFTTNTVAQRVRASRFQCTSFSSAQGTTTSTNTMSSGVRYTAPAPSTALPPLCAQQPVHTASAKPARVIQCDPLPGGKFPTTYSGLDYDTSKETMARTADEDYVIWKWITKLGKDWGEQGLNWLQRQELIWRKRSACYRQMVRKHMKEEEEREAQEKEVQAIIDKANAEVQYERIVQRALAIALAAQPATEAERGLIVQEAIDAALAEQSATETLSDDAVSETSSDDSESDGQTTILSGFITLTSRWTAALARKLGFRRSS